MEKLEIYFYKSQCKISFFMLPYTRKEGVTNGESYNK